MKRRVGLLAMLALNAVPADAAETLGRLFYTPANARTWIGSNAARRPPPR